MKKYGQRFLWRSMFPVNHKASDDKRVCAKRIVTLVDLAHLSDMFDAITLDDYERITGLAGKSARKSVERLAAWLADLGITLRLECTGEVPELRFDRRQIRRFLVREEGAALRLLTDKRKGAP